MTIKRSFPPVVNKEIKLLILGSLPGERSLAQSQYYAHPQNKFWELAGAVIGTDLRSRPYEARLQTLLAHGVGLWDVIAEAERKGSLDAAIRNETHNLLCELIENLPLLKAVAFNGGTAGKMGRKQLATHTTRFELIDLPSSSPAYTLPYAEKLKKWSQLSHVI